MSASHPKQAAYFSTLTAHMLKIGSNAVCFVLFASVYFVVPVSVDGDFIGKKCWHCCWEYPTHIACMFAHTG